MNDAAGCNSIADAVGGGATANPSPVPLATPTTNPSPNTCGAPSISNDGNTSVNFTGTISGSYFVVPSGALPGLAASWSICGAVKAGLYGGNISGSGNEAIVFAFENAAGSQGYLTFLSGTLVLNGYGSAENPVYDTGNAAELECLTANTTSMQLWINGTIVFSGLLTTPNAGLGLDIGNGAGLGAQNKPFIGRMCCIILANTVLTQAQMQAMTAALGY